MSRLVVEEFMSLDGVIQAPGHEAEDPRELVLVVTAAVDLHAPTDKAAFDPGSILPFTPATFFTLHNPSRFPATIATFTRTRLEHCHVLPGLPRQDRGQDRACPHRTGRARPTARRRGGPVGLSTLVRVGGDASEESGAVAHEAEAVEDHVDQDPVFIRAYPGPHQVVGRCEVDQFAQLGIDLQVLGSSPPPVPSRSVGTTAQ